MGFQFPIHASRAFRIALEDPATIAFMRKNFSLPEQNPEIISRKWLMKDLEGYRWNVEILEKNPFFLQRKIEMINVALIEIDSHSGKIISRFFFSSLLLDEYTKIISERLFHSV